MSNSTAHIGNSGYNMGKGGYAGYSRIQLPGMGSPQSINSSSSPATKFRKDILFYFSNLELNGSAFGFDDVKGLGSNFKKTQSAIKKAKAENWGAESPKMKTLKSAVEEGLKSVRENAPSWLSSIADKAIASIQSVLPDILKGLVSELGKLGVPVLSNITGFAKSFASGVSKVLKIWNTRGVYQTLRQGAPTEIVKILHKELKEDAATAFANAIYEIAKGVATTITVGASLTITGVIDAIKGSLEYLWGIYKKVRDYYALKKYITECKEHFSTNSKHIFNQKTFLEWFSHWLDELPIIASHCICSSVTGSYMGFMTAVKDDGQLIANDQLKRGHSQFVELKKPAKDYVKKYPHTFTSNNIIVGMSLKITEKGGYDTTDGAAAKSVSWFRKGLMKIGLQNNTLY